MKDIKVGVIGCGYWGPNLIRNLNENPDTDVVYACDLDKGKLERIKLRYPNIDTSMDYKDLLRDDRIDAVAIATPVFTHYAIAYEAIERGKHVLIEKPFTSNVREAESLVDLASQKGVILFVDHTYLYTGEIKRIKELVNSGDIGDLYYLDAVRINLGLFQQDINVIWDLAPHDISIIDHIFGEDPVSVSANGTSHTSSGIEDVAFVTLKFQGSFIAHLHINWLSPVKIRKIILGGSKKMVVFDDLDTGSKLKIYDKGIMFARVNEKVSYTNRIQYRIGDMHAPHIESVEALQVMIRHFAECVKKKKRPLSDGVAGLRIVRILEATEKSLRKGGIKIDI